MGSSQTIQLTGVQNKTGTLYADVQSTSASGLFLFSLPIPVSSAISGVCQVTANDKTTTNRTAYFLVIFKAYNNAGTLTVSSTTTIAKATDVGLGALAVTAVSTGSNLIQVDVVGIAATTINWAGVLHYVIAA